MTGYEFTGNQLDDLSAEDRLILDRMAQENRLHVLDTTLGDVFVGIPVTDAEVLVCNWHLIGFVCQGETLTDVMTKARSNVVMRDE